MKPVMTLVLATTLLALGAVMWPAQFVPPGSGLIAHVEGKVYLSEQRVEPSNAPIYVINVNSVVRTENEGNAPNRYADRLVF